MPLMGYPLFMIIAIGTENGAKNEAVKNVISKVWPEASFRSAKTESGVADQPMSETEGIQGAINRAREALKLVPEADLGIGLEGYVDETEFGMFLAGAVVIIDKNGQTGLGTSAQILLPEWIAKELRSGKELGPLIQEKFKDEENKIRHTSGTGGILTNGLYNRVDEFTNALQCALAPFVSPKIYKQ